MKPSLHVRRTGMAVSLRAGLLRCALLLVLAPLAHAAPSIDLWYGDAQRFGSPGLATPYVNILGRVEDPSGVASLTYRLNGGEPRALAIGPDTKRLHAAGDFNADVLANDLLPGEVANVLTLTATAADGGVSTRDVTITLESDSWPMPYAIDWSATADVTTVAQVTDGDWIITGDGVRTAESGYDRILAVGDPGWTSYEVSVPITVHAMNRYAHIGLIAHWNGNTDDPYAGWQPKVGWNPSGAFAWYTHIVRELQFYDYQGPGPIFGANNVPAELPLEFVEGETWNYTLRVEAGGNSGARYRLKVWRAGDAEPVDWMLDYTGPADEPQSGGVGLLAFLADVTFGDVTVTPIETPPPPTSTLVSDDFGSPPDATTWTFVDPAGDGALSHDPVDGTVSISVPAGTSHDPWTGGQGAPWLRQATNDADFEVEVKFASALDASWQIQGVLVEQDAENFLRFDVYRQGDAIRVFAGSITDLVGTYRIDREIPYNGPFHLRVLREGSRWTLSHSPDGDDWSVAGSFNQALAVSAVGVHASNFTPNPAHTAVVDYFWNTAARGDDEASGCDVGDPGNTYTLARLEWALLSLPCEPPEGTTLASLFGDDIAGTYPANWRAYTYTPGIGYADPGLDGQLTAGQGFWIIHDAADGASDVVLDLPSGSRPIAGGPTPACSGDACLTTSLVVDDGRPVSWNLVGTGAGDAAGAPLAQLRITDGGAACAAADGGCDLSAAREREVGADVVYTFDGDYRQRATGETLNRWEGLWYPLREGDGTGVVELHWPLP